MNTLLASGNGLSDFVCSAEECLSWIIILLNILTVFYLVFCAYFRVTKAVKVIGYVWGSALVVGTVAVVAMHTCIFTVLSAVFTALILMAVLSVVFDKGVFATPASDAGKKKKPFGAYVVHKTDDGNYAFLLYKDKKAFVCRSKYKYGTLDEVKMAIEVCRKNGIIANIEDRTKSWIEYANHPKFELFGENGKYRFQMSLTSDNVMLLSDGFTDAEQCEKVMLEATRIVKSENVYFAEAEVISGSDFLKYISDEVTITKVNEEISITESEEKPVTEAEGTASGVVFNTAKKTLWELYAELTPEQREYFDKIRERAEGKENVKSSESKDAYTVTYGRDKVVKLRIRKNTVEAVFFVTDSAFKKLKGESEAKVKETPTVVKITDNDYFNFALETVDYKYDSIIEERNAKKVERKNKNA